MYRYLLIICLACLALPGLHAQEEVPEDPDVDPSLAVRRSTAHAMDFLLKQGNEHFQGFILSADIRPVYKKMLRRYRRITYTVRVPIYEYETIEVLRPVGSGSARRMVKREEERIVGIKGYNEEERHRLVLDPEGDIEQMDNVPVFDTENLDQGVGLPPGYLGYNGMALHTLLALGVSPDDERLKRLVATLTTYLLVFGLPDSTFDVAWLLAGFTKWPARSPDLDTVRLQLLRKLAAGQINRDVKNKGLWGVVCIDYESIALATSQQLQLYKELDALNAELKLAQSKKKERDIDKANLAVERKKTEIDKAAHAICSLTWRSGEIFSNYSVRTVLPVPGEGQIAYEGFMDQLYPVRLENEMCDLLRENVTDLEVTSLALFALAEAEANGFFPGKIPRDDVGGQALRPIETEEMIKNAFAGVVGCYDQRKKAWRMGIQWVNTRERYFREFAHILPIETAELDNPLSAMADVAAYQSLVSLDRIIGIDKLFNNPGAIITAVEERVAEDVKALEGLRKYPVVVKRDAITYYTFLNGLSGFQWSLGGLELLRPEVFETYSAWMIKRQRPDGSWGGIHPTTKRDHTYIGVDTMATRALMAFRYEDKMRKLDQPEKKWPYHSRFLVYGPESHTLECIRYLMNGTWPAVAVHWNADGLLSDPVALPRGLRYLNRRGINLSYVTATEWPPANVPDTPATVVLTGDQALSPEQQAALSPLFPYVKAGGVLLIEAPATENGAAFASSVAEALGPAIENRTKGLVPGDSHLLTSMEKRPPLQAVIREDGTVAALFLMIGKENSGAMITTSTAGRVIEAVIAARLPPLLLDPRYPVLDDTGMDFDFPDVESAAPAEGEAEPEIKE